MSAEASTTSSGSRTSRGAFKAITCILTTPAQIRTTTAHRPGLSGGSDPQHSFASTVAHHLLRGLCSLPPCDCVWALLLLQSTTVAADLTNSHPRNVDIRFPPSCIQELFPSLGVTKSGRGKFHAQDRIDNAGVICIDKPRGRANSDLREYFRRVFLRKYGLVGAQFGAEPAKPTRLASIAGGKSVPPFGNRRRLCRALWFRGFYRTDTGRSGARQHHGAP